MRNAAAPHRSSIERRVGGHVSVAGGLSKAINNALEIGGNCMQIFAGSPRLWARKEYEQASVDQFLDLVESNNLGPVFIHALYLVNLASEKPDLLAKSIDALVMDLTNGAKIKSAGVVVHIGSHLGLGFDAVKDRVVESIITILSKTSGCDLLLENDAGQNGKIGSFEELSYLISKVDDPRLRICLDSAHMFAEGVDLRSSSEVVKLVDTLKELKLLDRVKCLHLNDSASDLGSHRDIHANLGEGEIGLGGLSNLVNHPELKHLPLILETPGVDHSGPDTKNISVARSL